MKTLSDFNAWLHATLHPAVRIALEGALFAGSAAGTVLKAKPDASAAELASAAGGAAVIWVSGRMTPQLKPVNPS